MEPEPSKEMRRHRHAAPYVPTFLKHSGSTASPPPHAPTTSSSWTVTEGDGVVTLPHVHTDPRPAAVLFERSYKEAVLTSGSGSLEWEYGRHQPKRRTYSREQLLSLRAAALEELGRGDTVEVPPYGDVPRAFETLLQDAKRELCARSRSGAMTATPCDHSDTSGEAETYTEYLDGFRAARLSTGAKLPSGCGGAARAPYFCCVCAEGEIPCAMAQAWLSEIRSAVFSPAAPRALRCLAQPPEVFRSLLQISLILESKRGSSRLRWIAEQYPAVPERIREFLCGPSPHVALPPVTSHEEWTEMSRLMGFDAIRDNRTRIITDFSRHWKRRTIPYEQFLFFYSFRDHVPAAHVKNIITRSVKPGMVAMLTSNLQAMVLLHHHHFFIPQDHYWDMFRFLEAATGGDEEQYRKIRHLGLYLSASQRGMNFFSPVEVIQGVP